MFGARVKMRPLRSWQALATNVNLADLFVSAGLMTREKMTELLGGAGDWQCTMAMSATRHEACSRR